MRKTGSIESPSYLEMTLHLDGEESLILRVPTFWDDINKQWIGAIKTPKTNKLLAASGKDSFELQNNFTKIFSEYFNDPEMSDEILSMFKPLYIWEARESK